MMKKRATITFDADIYAALKALAKTRRLKLSTLVNSIVAAAVGK